LGEEFAEAGARETEFGVARGAIEPAEIDEEREFGPSVGGFGSEADFAENAGDIESAFLFDGADAARDAIVAAGPAAESGFKTAALRFCAALDEFCPARGGASLVARGFLKPSDFFALPIVEDGIEEILAVAEMPIEAAFADAEIAGEKLDADGFDAVLGETDGCGANPVLRLERRGSNRGRGGGSHEILKVRRDDTGARGRRQGRVIEKFWTAGGAKKI